MESDRLPRVDILGIAGLVVGIIGLIVAIAALLVAIYGIRDVREHVHMLLTMERNRAYTKILHKLVWEFVDPTDRALSAEIAQRMQEYTLLAQGVNPKMTLTDAQAEANNETITYAQMLVDSGFGTWKPDTDPARVRAVLDSYNADKNAAKVAKMFGGKLKLF
jgi:hypothetical protein